MVYDLLKVWRFYNCFCVLCDVVVCVWDIVLLIDIDVDLWCVFLIWMWCDVRCIVSVNWLNDWLFLIVKNCLWDCVVYVCVWGWLCGRLIVWMMVLMIVVVVLECRLMMVECLWWKRVKSTACKLVFGVGESNDGKDLVKEFKCKDNFICMGKYNVVIFVLKGLYE